MKELVPIHLARIRNGTPMWEDPDLYRKQIKGLEGKRVEVVIRQWDPPGTEKQRAYYFGVIIPMVAKLSGHSAVKVHHEMKKQFASTIEDGERIFESYKKMKRRRRSQYHKDVINFVWDFWHVEIPKPRKVDYE